MEVPPKLQAKMGEEGAGGRGFRPGAGCPAVLSCFAEVALAVI